MSLPRVTVFSKIEFPLRLLIGLCYNLYCELKFPTRIVFFVECVEVIDLEKMDKVYDDYILRSGLRSQMPMSSRRICRDFSKHVILDIYCYSFAVFGFVRKDFQVSLYGIGLLIDRDFVADQ